MTWPFSLTTCVCPKPFVSNARYFYSILLVFYSLEREQRYQRGGGRGRKWRKSLYLLNCPTGICQNYFCAIFHKDICQLPEAQLAKRKENGKRFSARVCPKTFVSNARSFFSSGKSIIQTIIYHFKGGKVVKCTMDHLCILYLC